MIHWLKEKFNFIQDIGFITKIREGNQELFGELHKRYVDSIYRYIFLRVNKDHATATDLTQQLFQKSQRNISQYDLKKGSYKSWLFRMAHALTNDASENTSRKHVLFTSIDDALGTLTKEQRAVLFLRFVEEMSPEEVAAVMENDVAVIRSLQYRGLQQVRKLLKKKKYTNKRIISEIKELWSIRPDAEIKERLLSYFTVVTSYKNSLFFLYWRNGVVVLFILFLGGESLFVAANHNTRNTRVYAKQVKSITMHTPKLTPSPTIEPTPTFFIEPSPTSTPPATPTPTEHPHEDPSTDHADSSSDSGSNTSEPTDTPSPTQSVEEPTETPEPEITPSPTQQSTTPTPALTQAPTPSPTSPPAQNGPVSINLGL